MESKTMLAIFGIILFSGLVSSEVIDASSIQQVNGQVVFSNVSCYTCEGANCNAAISTLTVQDCNLFGAECVTTFNINGSVSARGCSNLLSNTANATCISAPGQLCFSCVSPLCNVAMDRTDFVSCYQCDSYSNSECVWNPNDTSVSHVDCYGNCIVALLPKSSSDNETYETYRGCESEVTALGIDSCNATNDCWTCNSTMCNEFNEPSTRLTCNFCSNTQCNETFPQTCLSYRTDDKCAYVLNNDSSISYLVCSSNFAPATLEYMIGLGILVECNGANCNTLANTPNVTVNSTSCVSCSSDQNEFCATEPSMINATVECSELNKLCDTRITSDGHTQRGCMADLAQGDFLDCFSGTNTTYCATCNSTNCNNALFPANRLSCFVCNSDNDVNCESSPANATVCPIFTDNELCTQYIVNGTSYRGCSSQFPCTTQEKCTTCNTSACNNKDLSGGSATIQLTGAILIGSILVFLSQQWGL